MLMPTGHGHECYHQSRMAQRMRSLQQEEHRCQGNVPRPAQGFNSAGCAYLELFMWLIQLLSIVSEDSVTAGLIQSNTQCLPIAYP